MEHDILFTGITLDELTDKLRTIIETALEPLLQKEELLISRAEVFKLFNNSISKPTIISWTNSGKLKSYRIGRRVFYKKSEVLDAAKYLKKYGRD